MDKNRKKMEITTNQDSARLLEKLEQKDLEIQNLIEQLKDKEKKENEIYQQIIILQNSKSYRCGLLVKRFWSQFVKTNDRWDFCKWVGGKLIHKYFGTKLLSEFDPLENIKKSLDAIQYAEQWDLVFETATIKLKPAKSVVIFSAVPYYDIGGGQRPAQLARTFNALGYRVTYVYVLAYKEDNISDMFIPTVEHLHIDTISKEWFANKIKKDSIVIFEFPYERLEPYLDMALQVGCFTVYEHIDNWDSSLGSFFYDEQVFKRFLEKTGLITVTAKMLGEKIKEQVDREYLYLPNAVNTEIFEPLKSYQCPFDLVKGKRKTLVYIGSLWGEWFAWDIIDYVAKNCPDCEINLIGNYSGCKTQVKKARKNIHFLGLKKQTDLPAYLQYSDIALLPFKNCEIGKYVSPLKIFEYIAMNVKVVATDLDDIRNYPNVYCSDAKEDWVAFIREETELVDSSVFISENNWFARCAELIRRATVEEENFPHISVIVLNYNNKKVIRRCLDTLLAHQSRYHYEIIVVDNGSTDGSYEMLKESYNNEIVLLQNTKNGCSSGRNLGVREAKGEYVCFLDSDQWVVSDYWLDSAFEILQTNTDVGAVSWAAGWFSPGKQTGMIAEHLPNRGMDSAAVWYRMDIAYLGTGGLLMKKNLFQEIGGFDEYYDPTCYEDTDLSLKIRYHGYELAYCPYMTIMHLPHQTTGNGSEQHTRLMKKNGEYFADKWKKLKPELLEYYY